MAQPISREQRQIDCIQPHWTKFQTYDANIKIEIDFDPELDEYFGITTARGTSSSTLRKNAGEVTAQRQERRCSNCAGP